MTISPHVYEYIFKSRLSKKTFVILWLLYLLFAHLFQTLVLIECN